MLFSNLYGVFLDGLRIYIDGAMIAESKGVQKEHSTDQNTLLTVGKPNDEDKNFATFRMDLLAIYYYRLPSKYIMTLYGKKGKGFRLTEISLAIIQFLSRKYP